MLQFLRDFYYVLIFCLLNRILKSYPKCRLLIGYPYFFLLLFFYFKPSLISPLKLDSTSAPPKAVFLAASPS